MTKNQRPATATQSTRLTDDRLRQLRRRHDGHDNDAIIATARVAAEMMA
jgi:hypothetical protein